MERVQTHQRRRARGLSLIHSPPMTPTFCSPAPGSPAPASSSILSRISSACCFSIACFSAIRDRSWCATFAADCRFRCSDCDGDDLKAVVHIYLYLFNMLHVDQKVLSQAWISY